MASTITVVSEDRVPVEEARLRELSRALGEASELGELRRRALELYRSMPLPHRADHLWRFTGPGKLMPAVLAPAERPAGELAPAGGAAAVVELTPGRPPLVRLGAEAMAAGVSVEGFSPEHAPGGVVPAEHGIFEALNLAAHDAGAVVRIPARATVEQPIRVVVGAGAGTFLPRLLVEAGAGSVATVVEEHVGGGEEAHRIAVTELLAGEDARIEHVLVQRMERGSRGHLTARARAERGASVVTVLVALGGELVKADMGTVLAGERAASEILGFLLAEGRQHLDHHTVHHHVGPKTTSNIDFKVALTGRARSVYTGIIRIDETARTSEAYQENRNLLLSESCRADTIPELEILNEDVQCTHGATVAPIDEDQIFYLQSRGLPADRAARLIVRGFLEGTLSRLPGAVRRTVEPLIDERLAAFEGGHR